MKTTEEIITMAMELGNALAETDELEQLRNVQALLNEDVRSYELILHYQQARMKLEEQRSEGKIINKNDENHLQILEDQLAENETIQQLMQAQEKFDNLVQAVYFAINQSITGGQCSSGCDSCGGGCGTM